MKDRTEKEKMLAGEYYNSFVDELAQDRNKARELVFDYNHLRPSESLQKQEIIRCLLGSTGQQFIIEPPFHCDYGYNIHIGENFYANFGCTILDCAKVTIGDNVLLAPHVAIYTAGHPTDVNLRNAALEYAYPITIGHNVWIGGNVILLPGVTIGNNTIIGAGSVVTKDIPANVIAAGNPCRVIKDIE